MMHSNHFMNREKTCSVRNIQFHTYSIYWTFTLLWYSSTPSVLLSWNSSSNLPCSSQIAQITLFV